jgi:hypothetical protein
MKSCRKRNYAPSNHAISITQLGLSILSEEPDLKSSSSSSESSSEDDLQEKVLKLKDHLKQKRLQER